MKNNIRLIFILYSVLLIIFFWKTAYYWYNMRYMNEVDGDKLTIIALLAIELLSIFLICLSPKNKEKEKWIHRVCFLWELIMIVILFYNYAPMSHYVKCLAWPLFFESAYIFVRSDIRLVSNFRNIFYIFVFIGGLVFFASMGLKMFASQTNMIYFMLLPVPVIMLWKNIKLQYSILVFTSFFALMSMKRSMMLAVVLCWVIIVFKYLINTGRKMTAILLAVLLIGVAYGFFLAVDKVSGGGLSARTTDYEKEDISNGREGIYLVTLEMIARSSLDHMILGHGHNGVKTDSILDISAHNEFLEVIYDYGIIILLVYLGLWTYVIRQWLYLYRHNSKYFIPYTLSICTFFVMAMVSQLVLYVSYFLYLVMFWGMVHALKEREKNESIICNKRLPI